MINCPPMWPQQGLKDYAPETLVECDSFTQIDIIILHWLTERLLAEDKFEILD